MAKSIWYAGYHFCCTDCGEDTSNASTIGVETKREALALSRAHRCPEAA